MTSRTISFEKLVSSIDSVEGFSCFVENDSLIIACTNRAGIPSERVEFCLKDVIGEFDKIHNAKWSKPFFVNENKHYEARVFYQGNSENRPPLSFFAEDDLFSCRNTAEGISIAISDASVGFKLMTLCDCKSEDFGMPMRMRLRRLVQSSLGNKSPSFSEWISHFSISTVQVDSESELEAEYVADLLDGYYLNIAQVFSIVVTTRFPSKSRQFRSRHSGDIDLFPYKSHEESVAKYYLQAISSKGTPIAEYLSFYHVIEYQFDRELKNHIMELIQRAAYSCQKNKSMIESTFKEINSIYLDRKLRGQEFSDLARCISSFIEIPFLVAKIDELQSGASQYYQKNNVEFIVDDKNPEKTANLKIAFGNVENAYKQIAKRIYSVRCAIVHSKSNIDSRYEPFLHDELLHKEMPLVRAVAEEILAKTSEQRVL